ncbi:TetR/AcrR family transcriptional regulator [Rhizosaccharibacter radicis]|uniref:TetR/AcrR family transcriptional regulator n=1 Tax=Rhizosaccharibacter radicis TaxID=2782605 RepID=A0ABT1W0U4_9PROT|nr:TetR/AcrR family transcriptional regulator [Acetobacteraceae bacterium KSS12]
MSGHIQRKAQSRARILEEAAGTMREHGHDGIGVAALMKQAGLTHGGFYAHFPSRDDLVAHAVDRMFADCTALVSHHLDAGDPRGGLRSLIDYYLSDEARRGISEGCPLPSLTGSVPRMPSGARRRFEAGIDGFRASLERAFKAIGAAEPALMASSTLSEMVGAMALARAFEDDDRANLILEASREQIKTRLGL